MSDRFEGTGLLFEFDGLECLHVLAVRANGDRKPERMAIPVRPRGTPPKDRLTWEYVVIGDELEVSPSVKVGGMDGHPETFHNEGLWRVKFERFTPLPKIVWTDGVGDHGQRKRFNELNPGDFII